MRVSRTLLVSIAGEIALYTGVGVLAFVAIMLAQNIAQRLQDLVAVGFRWNDAMGFLRSLMPLVAAYSVPLGFLFGVLAAVARIASDAEWTALRTCGLGVETLLVPALALALAIAALTAVLMIRSEPAARRELRGVLTQVASRGGILEPGRFRSLGPRVLYVQSRDRENHLARILIADRSDPRRPFLIFAERGRFVFDRKRMTIRLELEHGDVHLELPDQDGYQRIAFERFDYAIDASVIFDRARGERPREMPFSVLARRVEQADEGRLPASSGGRDPNEFRAQYQRRLALPFAPLLFAALGVPLGLRRTRGARSWGILVCAALAGIYYVLLTFGEFLAESGAVPALVALWLPNLAFAAAALPLLRSAQYGET